MQWLAWFLYGWCAGYVMGIALTLWMSRRTDRRRDQRLDAFDKQAQESLRRFRQGS